MSPKLTDQTTNNKTESELAMTRDDNKMEKFDGTNYGSWSYRVRTKLESKGLWELVESEPKALPGNANDADKAKRAKEIARAKDIIVNTLTSDTIAIIQKLEEPHEIWKTLSDIFLKKKFGNVVQTFFNYLSYSFDGTQTMLQHLTKMNAFASSIKDMMNFEVPEELQVLIWLYSVHEKFPVQVQTLKSQENTPTKHELQIKLLAAYEELPPEAREQHEGDTALLANKRKYQGSNMGPSKRLRDDGSSGLKCYYCFKPNHTRSECRIRERDERNGVYRETAKTQSMDKVVMTKAINKAATNSAMIQDHQHDWVAIKTTTTIEMTTIVTRIVRMQSTMTKAMILGDHRPTMNQISVQAMTLIKIVIAAAMTMTARMTSTPTITQEVRGVTCP
jgi:hypothetical protein